MSKSPKEIFQDAYQQAQARPIDSLLSVLPDAYVEDLKTIVHHAASQKAVLGVLLTSMAYKIFKPSQDIRYHKKELSNGYSGRTFDTQYTTPFLQDNFSHFAMTESSWLTRSLEQPHPFTLEFPGRIRNKELKTSFLSLIHRLQTESNLAAKLLSALLALMIEASVEDETSLPSDGKLGDLGITKIVEAISQHINYHYSVSGAARIPVVVIYSVYQLLMNDVKRYDGKRLAPLGLHTTADLRSKSLGDIEILDCDDECFEAIEIKHLKPITVGMLGMVYRKIRNAKITRYYVLTTSEPNVTDASAVNTKIAELRKSHSCQIILNGVLPSLKYYLRLVRKPEDFVIVYTQCLKDEYQRASGIKKEHLKAWADIWQDILQSK